MTEPFLPGDINVGGVTASVTSTALNATQQGATDTAVFRFDPIVEAPATASGDVFTVTTTAAAGTVITILQPGLYSASVGASIAAAACAVAVSLGGTAAPFTTAPIAFGTVDGVIAMHSDVLAAQAGVQQCSTTFRIAAEDIDGTANLVRFMGTVGGAFVATMVSMSLVRLTGS